MFFGGKNKETTWKMELALRITGSQNWWLGDPRTLLFHIQTGSIEGPMILRVNGKSEAVGFVVWG